MLYSSKARLLAAGTAFSIFAGPAFALDGNDLMTKINAALVIQGGSLQADSVAVNGSTVTLSGARFKPDADIDALPIGTVTMDGVEENDGGYTIEKVSLPNVNAAKDGTAITATDMTMSGITVPGDPNKGTLESLLIYEEAHIGSAGLTIDGKPVLSIGDTKVTTDVADDASSLNFDLKMHDLKVDLGTVDDPQSRETINALGLTSLNGEISMEGSWAQNDGTIDVTDYSIDFDKVGKLAMTFSLSGYTLDFIKAAQDTAKQMESSTNKEEAQQAANLAMLGLLQRLTFNSADLRFEDDGFTKRALDYAGKSQNTTGPQMAQMLKAMTPIVLAQYNMPELQNMLSEAVNTFLDKPESFTITVEPPKPVPFPMIMGAAMGAPNTLPQVLGVKVSAND